MVWRLVGCRILGAVLGRRMVLSYPVTYSYDTGTLIMEMVDLRQPADKSNQNKLPVIWHAYASGLLYGNSHFNMQLTLNAVNQAFAQSPYLSNKQ